MSQNDDLPVDVGVHARQALSRLLSWTHYPVLGAWESQLEMEVTLGVKLGPRPSGTTGVHVIGPRPSRACVPPSVPPCPLGSGSCPSWPSGGRLAVGNSVCCSKPFTNDHLRFAF